MAQQPTLTPCKLCGRNCPLSNSHFLPKHVYRRYRRLTAPGTSIMLLRQQSVFALGKEITKHLLCEECEGEFNRNGEDYFAEIAMPVLGAKSPPFLFRILRASLVPLWNLMGTGFPGLRLGFSLGSGFVPQVDSKALFYFAVSMFWRGGLQEWGRHQPVTYDDGLMEKMRQFLLGEATLPGYVVRVLPSFWANKYGAVLPMIFSGTPFFSIYMYDFYLEKVSERSRAYEGQGCVPILYTADSFKSIASHRAMTHALEHARRTKGLPAAGALISWRADTNEATKLMPAPQGSNPKEH